MERKVHWAYSPVGGEGRGIRFILICGGPFNRIMPSTFSSSITGGLSFEYPCRIFFMHCSLSEARVCLAHSLGPACPSLPVPPEPSGSLPPSLAASLLAAGGFIFVQPIQTAVRWNTTRERFDVVCSGGRLVVVDIRDSIYTLPKGLGPR